MAEVASQQILPLHIIFSCSICHATVSELYQTPDYDKGFRDGGGGDEQRPVTKLWLTECGHVVCSRHLEGGGVPFHPGGEQPCAACPVCSARDQDLSEKALYAIQGLSEGQYDSRIPKEWFDVPPVKLGGKDKSMLALNFHYQALINFGMHVTKELQKARQAAPNAAERATGESTAPEHLDRQMNTLRTRVAELEQCEKALKPWKDREPKIKFYLDLFPRITKENERLREQLTAMGYAVPRRSYSLTPNVTGHNPQSLLVNPLLATTSEEHQRPEAAVSDTAIYLDPEPDDRRDQRASSDRTMSGPRDAIVNLHAAPADPGTINKKRQKDVIEPHRTPQADSRAHRMRSESRHLMPPPPLPFGGNRSPAHRITLENNGRHPQLQRSEARQDPLVYPNTSLMHHSEILDPSVNLGEHIAFSPRDRSVHSSYFETRHENDDAPAFGNLSQRYQYQDASRENAVFRCSHPTRSNGEQDSYEDLDHLRQYRPADDYEQQPASHSSYGLQEEVLDRAPLRGEIPSIRNFQMYDHGAKPSAESIRTPSKNLHRAPRALQLLPVNDSYAGPSTPSPSRRTAIPALSKAQSQSVVSPFFNRQTGMQHFGRMILSPRVAARPVMTQSRTSPLRQNWAQTPKHLARKDNVAPDSQEYLQSTPSRGQFVSNAQRPPHLTSNGLFRRPDAPTPHSITQSPLPPYFHPGRTNQTPNPNSTQNISRPNLKTQRIPTLAPSTPSIRSNIYLPHTRTSPRKTFNAGDGVKQFNRAELTDYDLGYAGACEERRRRNHEYGDSSTGLKSGVSRPSNEFARDPSGSVSGIESRGFGAPRRSIRR